MKFLVLAFALLTVATAAVFDIPTHEYLSPSEQAEHVRVGAQPIDDFLPPVLEVPQLIAEPQQQDSAVLADDGYHYKVVRRNKYRHRRDVNELPYNENLPPLKQYQIVVEPQDFAPQALGLNQRLADQPSSQYLPPQQQRIDIRFSDVPTEEYVTPVLETPQILSKPEQQNTAILAADGYHYKVGNRQRRDVNELPLNEYLPPLKQFQIVVEPQETIAQEVVPQESAVLADDGYRYKVVRRNKYRQRRV